MEIVMQTIQEIFDKVLVHSRSMTEQSVQGVQCRYRCQNGNKCFIGALIPDEKYDFNIEGISCTNREILIAAGIVEDKEPNKEVDDKFLEQLRLLQQIHDNSFKNREYCLMDFARLHNLKYTYPNEQPTNG